MDTLYHHIEGYEYVDGFARKSIWMDIYGNQYLGYEHQSCWIWM